MGILILYVLRYMLKLSVNTANGHGYIQPSWNVLRLLIPSWKILHLLLLLSDDGIGQGESSTK